MATALPFSIFPSYLAKEEIEYELAIRGLSITGSVSELRSTLRSVLALESSGEAYPRPAYPFVVAEQLAEIQDVLRSIKQRLDASPCVLAPGENRRLTGRLRYYHRRISELIVPADDAAAISLRRDLLVKALCYVDLVRKIGKGHSLKISAVASTSAPDPSIAPDVADKTRSSEEDTDSESLTDADGAVGPRFRTSSIIPPFAMPSNKSPSVPVHKWNLKFSGDPNAMSVHSFLERVEELCAARHVSDKELFDSAIDLFDDKALLWYRVNRTRAKTWCELKTILMSHFSPPDYRPRLFQEILERTQRPSESIVDFLTCMASMFLRHGDISPELQLDIVSRNLAPFYVMNLPSVNSLEELERACLALEVKKSRCDHYRSTLSASRFVPSVDPEFRPPPTRSFPRRPANAFRPSATPVHSVRASESPATPATASHLCWNCRLPGHRFATCAQPRRRFCFRCGKSNFTVNSCPICSASSENSPGRV